MVITANRTVVPCCFDKKAEFAYQTVGYKNLKYLFNTTEVKKFQSTVWKNSEKIKICQNCTEGLKQTWFS